MLRDPLKFAPEFQRFACPTAPRDGQGMLDTVTQHIASMLGGRPLEALIMPNMHHITVLERAACCISYYCTDEGRSMAVLPRRCTVVPLVTNLSNNINSFRASQ